jgi:hypothetical protein
MVCFFPVLEILEQMGHEHDLSWHKTSVFVKTAVLPSYGALPPVAVKKIQSTNFHVWRPASSQVSILTWLDRRCGVYKYFFFSFARSLQLNYLFLLSSKMAGGRPMGRFFPETSDRDKYEHDLLPASVPRYTYS